MPVIDVYVSNDLLPPGSDRRPGPWCLSAGQHRRIHSQNFLKLTTAFAASPRPGCPQNVSLRGAKTAPSQPRPCALQNDTHRLPRAISTDVRKVLLGRETLFLPSCVGMPSD
jgi:hypothetical protein